MSRHIFQKRTPQPFILDFGRSLVQQMMGNLTPGGSSAGRLPIYLATLNYIRFGGVILFNLLALAGLGFNVYHHRCLRRLAQ